MTVSQGLASSHYYPSARLKTSDSLENLPYGSTRTRTDSDQVHISEPT